LIYYFDGSPCNAISSILPFTNVIEPNVSVTPSVSLITGLSTGRPGVSTIYREMANYSFMITGLIMKTAD
jgi:hypothetical protein